MSRKPLSKKVRFEVFKRDGFVCQYCGAHPPSVVLEVDHIIAVANGGGDEMDNLITACLPCNRGKGAVALNVAPQSLAEKAAEIAEREEQLRGYAAVLDARRQRLMDDVWRVIEHWQGDVDKVPGDTFSSVKMFIERLGVHEVLDAVDIMHGARIRGVRHQLRYLAGICWNKIRRLEN